MGNYKWTTKHFDKDKPIYVVLFISRNKDNKSIKDFKQRRASFITQKSPAYLYDDFMNFVKQGQKGEKSRLYYSVNARDPKKIHNKLLHFLIDNPDFNLCAIDSKIAGIAQKKECRLEDKWMFDFDSNSSIEMDNFCDEIEQYTKETVSVHSTPNGFAIITEKHFDPRELLQRWGDIVTLKRDDLFCYCSRTK